MVVRRLTLGFYVTAIDANVLNVPRWCHLVSQNHTLIRPIEKTVYYVGVPDRGESSNLCGIRDLLFDL